MNPVSGAIRILILIHPIFPVWIQIAVCARYSGIVSIRSNLLTLSWFTAGPSPLVRITGETLAVRGISKTLQTGKIKPVSDLSDIITLGSYEVNLSPRGWFALSILFSLTVIVIVFITTFNEETIGYILHFNIFFLCLAIAFRLLALVIWGMRIKVMSGSLGYGVPLPHCVNMVLAGLLAGTITPGQAGGEPVRVHELYRSGVKLGDAAGIVIMERVLDGIVLTVMGVILMTLLTRFFLSTFSPALMALVIVAWIFMISFLIIPLLAIRYPERTKKALLKLVRWLSSKFSWGSASPENLVNLADSEIDNLFGSMVRFTGTARFGLLGGAITTGLFWITEFLVASVIMMGLGLGPAVVESFFFQILIAIINMIPLTPGSSGVVELSTSSLYALLIPTGMIGIFVLLWRFVTFYLNIILGAVAGLAIFRRELELRNTGEVNEEKI
jgi:glycosyltransferase 2 family protein